MRQFSRELYHGDVVRHIAIALGIGGLLLGLATAGWGERVPPPQAKVVKPTTIETGKAEPLAKPTTKPVAKPKQPVTVTTANPVLTVERLLFCNRPERLAEPGIYAEATLPADQWTRVFFHYRNTTTSTAPFVVAVLGSQGEPLSVEIRKGIAEPTSDPPTVGQQAMGRYLQAPTQTLRNTQGFVRFPLLLKSWAVASGVLTVRPIGQDVRLRIYFKNAGKTVSGMQVAEIKVPVREIEIELTEKDGQGFARIGIPAPELRKQIDGTYGFIYTIRVRAPEGKTVRVLFSPRGGQAGLVGVWNGKYQQSPIVPATTWAIFGEKVAGKEEMVLWTSPFGGVFYPVELAFRLM